MRKMNIVRKYRNRAIAVLTAAVMAVVLCACGKAPAETVPSETAQTVPATEETVAATQAVRPELSVDAVTEQDDAMVVSTTYCELKYPFAFADLMQVKAENQEEKASLIFYAVIAGEEHHLFTIHFGGTEGILLGSMAIADAEPENVYGEFAAADEAALGENIGTFHAVQESFNDVVASLMENQNFTPAQ